VPVEFESQSINLNYPNQFILYDCSTKQKEIINDSTRQLKEVDLQLDRLYSVDEMANQKSDYDSYRIRYTDSNNLVVPYVHEIEATGLLMQKVRIYRNGRSFKDLNSSSSISISKNEKYLMTGGNVGDKFGVSVYSQSGNLISFIPNIYFGDFTGSSQVMYIRQGTLVFRDNSGDTSKRIYVHPRMYYAYADAENKFALAKTSDSLLFLIDINKKSFQTFKETLQGVDFKKRIFITTPKHGSRLATMVNKWDFEGKKLDSFYNKEGFKQVIFNEQTGEVLALNKTFQLFWLNKDLVPRTAFQITTNDPFGFSKNGQTIYYIRDDFMNMYRYDSKPVNLTDFDAAYGWLNTQYHNKKVKFTAEERKAYNLNFPSDHFFGGKN
jgi:hypothetical protein